MQTAPDVNEVLEFLSKRLRMRSEICRVNPTGRDAGQNIRRKVWKRTRQMTEHADLVRSTRTAAGEHESQVGPLLSDAYSLREVAVMAADSAVRGRGERDAQP